MAGALFNDMTEAMFRLTADVKWPPSTPFTVALGLYCHSWKTIIENGLCLTGPLAGVFPILSLRTLKADVAVGITEDRAKALDAEDPKWRINGK